MYWILSAANTRSKNSLLSISSSLPHGDKIGHFLVMGLLAFMVNRLLDNRFQMIGKRKFLLGSLIVAAIVTAEEFCQIFIPSRTFSPFDLLADFAGIFVFGRLAIRRGRQWPIDLFQLFKYQIMFAFQSLNKAKANR